MAGFQRLGARFIAFVSRATQSETTASIIRRLAPSAIVAAAVLPINVVAAYAVSIFAGSGTPGEYPLFGPAGNNLLSGHWNLVFVSPIVQAGPFELLPYGVAHALHISSALGWFFFYVVTLYVLTFLFLLVVFVPISEVTGRMGRYIPILVAAVAIIGAFLPTVLVRAHTAEAMIPLLWIVAGALSRERRFAAAGVLVALSAGFEVWGVLGIPVVFLAVRPNLFRAAAGAVITLLVIYLPFALTGTFRMFGFSWPVSIGTIYRFLWPHLDSFPWTLRVAQAILALAAGWGTALAIRKIGPYGVWLVPMAILCVRLVFDPLLFFYYWMAPATVALCALAATLYLRKWIGAAISAIVIAVLWIPPQRSVPTAVGMSLLVAACVVALRIVERRKLRHAPAEEPAGAFASSTHH